MALSNSSVRAVPGHIAGVFLGVASMWVAGAAEVKDAGRKLSEGPGGRVVLEQWQRDAFQFTPAVRNAYLNHVKAEVRKTLGESGRTLPEDFLKWVESDPLVEATVYGARRDAERVLWMLRSLELDLGERAVRVDYTQLALAMAVVHADKGAEANLSPRGALQLVIPGDPRKPVDTKDPKRTLDQDDHIINFLNSRTIEEEVVVGHKEEPAPLKYDDKGIAIPPPKHAKPVKVPIKEKRTRTLYAADVIASRPLQLEFNAYMKSHGQNVEIDCGDKVVFWNSKEAVHAERKRINEAFVLFRTAYERKGLLPAARDPFPSPAEAAAFLIRNDKYLFPPDQKESRKWPRYPLKAPWPTLTLLAADNQPLREREERWLAFRDKGEMRTYGEYIGPIAQQFDMQSARRLSPHPFHYGTYQMMAKDGGVCGTMANMGVRTQNTLGIPSCTAGQPGHCALIYFAHDPKTGLYECKGGQFATGGPEKTSPHTPWCFGDVDAKKPMVYYQTIAWSVNGGFREYLDSTLAFRMYCELSGEEKAKHGMDLLESGLRLNPYNILLVDTALAGASAVGDPIRFWKCFKTVLASVTRPGCPKDGLYVQVVRDSVFATIARLPVPADASAAGEVLAFLDAEKCDHAGARVAYQIKVHGLDEVLRRTERDFSTHLAGARNDASCQRMADSMNAVAKSIAGKKQRTEWARARMNETAGKVCYFGPKNKMTVDACVPVLAKLSGTKMPAEAELQQPLLMEIEAMLKQSVDSNRDLKSCKQLADRITAAAGQIKEPARKSAWLDSLSKIIRGREQFKNPKGVVQTDPCADALRKLSTPG